MIKLSPEAARRLLSLHGRFAVALGLLLYVLIVTGVSSVFAPEIADWSAPLEARQPMQLPAGLDRGLRAAATQVEPRFIDDVSAFAQAGGRIQAFFHTQEIRPDSGDLEDVGVEFDLDPLSFEILDRREGWHEDIQEINAAAGLAHFLTELHVRLHIPEPYGLVVTGILGLALLFAAISGLLMHRHLLRDLFVRRGSGTSPLAARDTHVGAASWMLPFALILAFTGCFFSFVNSFGLPTLARISFGGDEQRLGEVLVGVPPEEDPRPVPTADVDAMIADAARRGGAEVVFVEVERWGRADARVSVFMDTAPGRLTRPSYVYAGIDGRLLHEKPVLGLVPSVSGSLFDVISSLHYGRFAGVWSKTVWVALGFGLAFVVLTGLLLWCRRRRDAPAWRRLERVAHWVGYGLPLALVATPYGYFPAYAAGVAETSGYIYAAFASATIVAAAAVIALRQLGTVRRFLLGLTGAALLGLPLLRLVTGGLDWVTAAQGNAQAVIALDVAFVLAGAACAWIALRPRRAPAARPTAPEPAPAISEIQ